MQTTELFVEQVLIGLLVFIAALAVASPPKLDALRTVALGEGAFLLGGAYLIGILFDRYADTLLDGPLRYHRLIVALAAWSKECKRQGMDPSGLPSSDPFPEHRLRLASLRDE